MLAIKQGGVRLEPTGEVGIESVQVNMQTTIGVDQTASRLQCLQVMLLIHLALGAMIRRTEDGGSCAVAIERGILRAIGEETCEREMVCEAKGGSSTLQVVISTRGVSPEGGLGASE